MLERNRYIYGGLAFITMILGLLSRRITNLPYILSTYSGDILWALMIFFMFIFVFNKKSTFFIAGIALSFSYMIEISQLYHGVLIDSIRNTMLGALILGYGFLWSDIICYTLGVLFGIFIDRIIIKLTFKHN